MKRRVTKAKTRAPTLPSPAELLALASSVLDGEDAEIVASDVWRKLDALPAVALEAVTRRASPVTFEVIAALTAVVNPKDYAMVPVWEATRGLTEVSPAPLPSAAAEVVALGTALLASLQGRRRKDTRGSSATITRLVDASVRETRDRLLPLGAGGSVRQMISRARPFLWLARHANPATEALCAAFDAAVAGSREGVLRVARIADENRESPAILWLDEFVHRAAGKPTRGRRAARDLNVALASGAFGRNARQLAIAVELGRAEFGTRRTEIVAAWRALATVKRIVPREPKHEEISDIERSVLRTSAESGDPRARLVLEIDDVMVRTRLALEREAEREGPFRGLYAIPRKIEAPLEAMWHFLVLGFREVYGLELLRSALPRLREYAATLS